MYATNAGLGDPLPHFQLYEDIMPHPMISIREHGLAVGIRHDLWVPPKGVHCPMCKGEVDHRGQPMLCPAGWMYWMHHHYELARVVPEIYTPWRYTIPTEHGTLVFGHAGPFLLRVQEFAADEAEVNIAPCGPLHGVPVYHLGRTGDISSDMFKSLLTRGPSRPMLIAILRNVVLHTT